jgi:trigger factor
MKQEALRQFGGDQKMDLSQLPSELFKDQAEVRIKTGLLFAAVIKENELVADAEKVEAKIQELAASYETPDEVISWYGKPENRAQIEALVVEEAVVDLVVLKAKVKKKKMSYEDAVKPLEQKTA